MKRRAGSPSAKTGFRPVLLLNEPNLASAPVVSFSNMRDAWCGSDGGGVKAVNSAADFEQTKVAFSTLIGDAAKADASQTPATRC